MTSFHFPAKFRRLMMVALGLVLLISAGGFVRAQTTPTTEQPTANAANSKPTVLNETDEYRLSPTVVKLGALLGMKPETAANAFTIFNILILVVAIGYGLLKTLPKAFKNRNTEIQKHLVEARAVTEEATARLSSVEERLSKLDDQIAAMRHQAEAESEKDEQRIKASVEDEKVKIVAAAEAEIQNATTLARREIQKYAAELAIEQAARKLVVTAETDRLLVESFAHKLGEGSNN
jgi:F-type H+-transporting ATPase subunit b